ncbi:hypothetical protein [Nocardia vermiculata]|uniref:Integral membrane protein n=1 Tax=Nocardia vermiculata TaxID=257274 RepID=A0A846XVH2_9NOCA|nr:hypothetical protein [Nocardia vermiculata]NKY50627.1 hypothetical protein [Nocardia vermiculata]
MTTLTVPTARVDVRTILRIDGWSTGVFGLVMLALAYPLREPLGLPTAWSIPFGAAMLGGALALLLIAGYPEIQARMVAGVIVVNLASAVGMTVLTVTGIIALTGWGVAFMLIGAVTVAVFAELEYVAMRRSR